MGIYATPLFLLCSYFYLQSRFYTLAEQVHNYSALSVVCTRVIVAVPALLAQVDSSIGSGTESTFIS